MSKKGKVKKAERERQDRLRKFNTEYAEGIAVAKADYREGREYMADAGGNLYTVAYIRGYERGWVVAVHERQAANIEGEVKQ